MNTISLKVNPGRGELLGKVFEFDIENLKENLIEILRTLELEVPGYTPYGIRLSQDWDNPRHYKFEIYVKDERYFLT